jgi:quercetin dioxygenase-like cupin family protein
VSVDIRSFPRPDWEPVRFEGWVGVEGREVVHDDDLLVAMVRFSPDATIHGHEGLNDAIVACLEGEGFTSVGDETAPMRSGEQVRWPKGVHHRLWTEGSTMVTPMIERL